MAFLHPWAIGIGAAAAVLPLAMHWLTRPRPKRLPFSTVRFVREVLQQRRARNRLRDWTVLALRTAAVGLLACVVARPLFGEPSISSAGEPGEMERIVLVDISASMGAETNGIQLFERARPLAAGYVADEPALRANLILAGATPHPVFERLSTNFAALRQGIAEARVRPERLNAQAAINLTAELFARAAGNAGRRREVVVISDFQRSNWAAVDFSVLSEDVRIRLDSIAPAEPLPNLAVLRVGSQGRVEQNHEVKLAVEVGNFSSTARQVQVELLLGESSYRLSGLCPAASQTTLSTDVILRQPGWQSGLARLVDVQDPLPADNVRPFVLEVRSPPTYALITRQPAETRPSSSYYLERALVPVAPRPGQSEGRVVRIGPTRLDRDSLGAAEVLVLDHPGKLPAEAMPLLASFLRRGRGILYVAAEPMDATNLKLLADAAGSALQMPVEFVPPPAGLRRRDLFLNEIQRGQAPFNVFGDSLSGLIGPLRFSGGLASRRLEGGLADDVVAAYSDRSACLVVTACGAGALAVLNADLASSNLPASPAFVPLIGELVGRLLGRQRLADAAACGEPLAVFLPTSAGPAAGLSIIGPDGKSEGPGQLVEESGSVLWRASSLEAPGVYQVKRDNVPVYAVAAAIPSEESDLRPLDPSVFQGRLAGGRTIHYRSAASDEEKRDTLWIWLAVACVACMLGEVGALKAFRT